MTTATATFTWDKAANAAAQGAYVNGVKDLLTAAGLVQTTDTGQIVGDTYVAPSGANLIGYLVFRFPDALQATAPIFIRAEFRVAWAVAAPAVTFVVGSGTDGAGTITGNTFSTSIGGGSMNQSPWRPGLPSYACYVDGTFSCVLGVGANPTGSVYDNDNLGSLVVDRQRNNAGVAQGSGYLCEAAFCLTNTCVSRALYGALPTPICTYVPALVPNLNAISSSEGANVNVFRHLMMSPGVHPSLGSLSYLYGDFGAGVPVTVDILGGAHTYLPMGKALNCWSATAGFDPNTYGRNHCGMIRWE